MIIPDVNLLVYAYNPASEYHDDARKWWENLLNSEEPVGLPWLVLMGFLRVSTLRGILKEPVAPSACLATIESWLGRPCVSIVNPGREHLTWLKRHLKNLPGGHLAPDAHIAALASEFNATVHSNDTDFSRFPGLKWVNPLRKR
jgi:toxin-antitoxin system PIN domain toxin